MQAAVMALITGREAGDPGVEAGTLIVGDVRASADERLRVYAHMYRARIVEALESQFPRLAKMLGPDAFAELASAYITDEPSRHPSLRYVGERLPAWLMGRRCRMRRCWPAWRDSNGRVQMSSISPTTRC